MAIILSLNASPTIVTMHHVWRILGGSASIISNYVDIYFPPSSFFSKEFLNLRHGARGNEPAGSFTMNARQNSFSARDAMWPLRG